MSDSCISQPGDSARPGSQAAPCGADSWAIERLGAARRKIMQQLSRVIVGQQQVIDELLISLFSRGHCLLEGVPGLAKTLMVSTLAEALNLLSRIQLTDDAGRSRERTSSREWRRLVLRLLFSAVVSTPSADEINLPPKRKPPCWRRWERQVTVAGSATGWPTRSSF